MPRKTTKKTAPKEEPATVNAAEVNAANDTGQGQDPVQANRTCLFNFEKAYYDLLDEKHRKAGLTPTERMADELITTKKELDSVHNQLRYHELEIESLRKVSNTLTARIGHIMQQLPYV